MLELGEPDIEQIRRLALDPTPANWQAIQTKLQAVAAALSSALADPDPLSRETAVTREFLRRLPAELARVQTLMHAPLAFYQRLETLRMNHFGAYERSGALRSLEAKPFSRTVLHL